MFAKVFSQIFDSSIREDPAVRFTFMDFLILADVNGVVDMTQEAISARTNRPIEVIRETILQLQGPDPRSRTPDNEGRRIVLLDEHRDWGWLIVNYDRFRKTASAEQQREKTLARVRKYRNSSTLQSCNAPVTHGNACNAMQKQKQKQKEKSTHASVSGFEEFWKEYPKKKGKLAAQRAWPKTKGVALSAILSALSEAKDCRQWRKDNGQFIPNPASWLNAGGWMDESGEPVQSERRSNYAEPSIVPELTDEQITKNKEVIARSKAELMRQFQV